jgi:hypothetical protein
MLRPEIDVGGVPSICAGRSMPRRIFDMLRLYGVREPWQRCGGRSKKSKEPAGPPALRKAMRDLAVKPIQHRR